jgi:hypothetical protein
MTSLLIWNQLMMSTLDGLMMSTADCQLATVENGGLSSAQNWLQMGMAGSGNGLHRQAEEALIRRHLMPILASKALGQMLLMPASHDSS